MNQSPGHRPRRRFGQNFLHDANIIGKIIAAIDPQARDHLVEIGPGLGALTTPLLQSGSRLTVVELDRDLIPGLEALREQYPRLEIHSANALKLDFTQLAHDQPLRMVGNLPYNISTPLLFHLFNYKGQIQDFHFMLQKEVVERMAAPAGSKTYGRLSVMTQFHCQVIPLFQVPPGAFHPPPKVTSSIVRLIPHCQTPFDVDDVERFATLVRAAFSMRRKTLSNALKALMSSRDIEDAGIDPGVRAEQVSVTGFAALSRIRCGPGS